MEVNISSVLDVEEEGWTTTKIGNGTDDGNRTFIYDIRKIVYPIMMPIILALCFISLLLSSFIVCSIPYVKRPMSATVRLSLSLSAANVAFSGVVFIGTIIHSYLPGVFQVNLPNCLNLAVEALRLSVMLVQVYHLLAVALIHYLGTLRPLQYASIITPYCLKVIVGCLWTIPILGIFIGFFSVPDQGFQSEDCADNHFRIKGFRFRYVWSLIYFGPTAILIMVYLHIFFILNQRGKNLIESGEQRKKLTKNMKTVKTTSLIVVTFLVGWTPAVLAFLLICEECYFQIRDMKLSMAIFSTTYILIILKVFVDTFIYALRLPEIREALRLLYRSVVSCSFGASNNAANRKFHLSSPANSTCRSTYLNSTHSCSMDSHKDRPMRQSLLVSKNRKPHVTVEMKPLVDFSSAHISR